jgi:hypothetical protein
MSNKGPTQGAACYDRKLDNNQDKLFQFEDSIAREDINEADTSKDETQSKIILSEKEIQTVIATTCASTQTEEVETVKDSPNSCALTANDFVNW